MIKKENLLSYIRKKDGMVSVLDGSVLHFFPLVKMIYFLPKKGTFYLPNTLQI